MKKVYVAHPYGGNEENKKQVENIIKHLVKENPRVFYISPIHATGFLYSEVSYEQGMKYCFELLRQCDELLLCNGWENSRGCKLEKEFAEANNINIIYSERICTHTDINGELTIKYDSGYEMRSSDMHCTQCGKQGSKHDFEVIQKRG